MKRHILIFLCFIILLCMSTACKVLPTIPSATQSEVTPSSNVVTSEENNDYVDEYKYEVINGTIKITDHYYDYSVSQITVPEEIDGKPVTALGPWAFYQHKSTASIILPSSLTTIEGAPFYRCYSLEESFIPSSVKEITGNPYFRASSLKKITVDPENEYFCDIDGILYSKDKTVLLVYPEGREDESYVVPESVVGFSRDPFGYHGKLKRITILSNVTGFPDDNMFIYPDDITLIVEAGSAAEEYAIKYGLKYEII